MGLMERLEKSKVTDKTGEPEATGQKPVFIDSYGDLKDKVHKQIIDTLNKEHAAGGKNTANVGASGEQDIIKQLINDAIENESSVSPSQKSKIAQELCDEVMGLGPLEPLLADNSISEIMVNGPCRVYIERKGKIELTNVRFKDDEHVMNVIDRIVSKIGRHIDEASPMVDARLSDGSRVNVIIPPLSLIGPVITIRKFSKIPLTVSDIIASGSISPQMAHFLESCVRGKANVIVSGGTGSGKTTLLNILSSFIPENERIVSIEDAAELQLRQEHVVTLESRPANNENKGQITIRDLLRNALRMRPDRILIGEVRSGEALDMLQAMNTGHDGSLTTAHANSPRDLLSRIETMVLMAGMELPIKAIREQISSAVDIIVQQSRFRDGTRKVVNITEVTGMESDIISLQDIFVYENTGIDESGKFTGRFKSTGIRPRCLAKLAANGIPIHNEWFG